ncbi:MAG: tRNA (adenosine(37)-N6)-threonylcarbamoyltransferase complex transferase subunit TsaD [Candidatus Izemoplasmatales bacterium]|jgi:N6-L-threonylcarbamoyladenine synthase|nr:tRNA (adenosine(37)-N6)-threonylcarbamoyltransferase complex transferase subunit TsaD [Candidatus Izemoplasmatales bacterium]MDD4354418.1 tRNA (adenosine(37)-N6)-threonylcarbamoyltransferase complex transferase subunit TsaD [Candidatus Izemoplasmatales bacterium]MDD4987416.1 tRNA (adenosine(37)-N6)-threonylcarbamoyltransferase complex transferase subunit TsaD [Candidatus Izemoplasmatales bacterium]MDD5601393.1 tRNA (adenosine(37)-N6)-threonylcarbamoyltransferase complex transferase subunit Ts
MIVMGIETSCDETSVSLVKDGKTVLSNAVLSQIDIHKEYGGVVPEIASREHVKGITLVFDQAMKQAKIDYSAIDLVAVTAGPGLIGSLLIGVNAAKVIAMNYQLPLIGVQHITGHIYANHIEHDMEFPLLALVVSGGHTELVLMREHFDFVKLGETQDDAVGEAYDKIARIFGLAYPGGPQVDKLAQSGKDTMNFPRPMIDSHDYNFSFSGLKSHVINQYHNQRQRQETISIENYCRSFQEAVTDVVVKKTEIAKNEYRVKQVIVAGGVAANKGLRAKMQATITDVPVYFPALQYCTDNAAMIAVAGYFKYQKHPVSDLMDLNGSSRLELV